MAKNKKLSPKRQSELAAQLAKMEAALKGLQGQFREIKKRTRGAIEGAITRSDARKLEELRKQLNLS